MEKKQLLIISKDQNLVRQFQFPSSSFLVTTSVHSLHAGYTLALSYLPDAILIDQTSLSSDTMKNLKSFKSTHFLNKSFLFLYADVSKRSVMGQEYGNIVDNIYYSNCPPAELLQKIDDTISVKRCLSNYWKDSFMGLFNLLSHPVILLQHEEIVAMNDAFKKYFFIKEPIKIKISDIVDGSSRLKVLETLRNFCRGKHMRTTIRASLVLMNNKLREATITFSKLDLDLPGQMVMMINFVEREVPINAYIGSTLEDTEGFYSENTSFERFSFTKREKEIIGLLCKGYKTKEISEMLCISSKTIEKHRSNIIRRTNSDTILESIVYALSHNIIKI